MEQRNNLVLQGTETFSRGQLDNVALENGALVLDSVAGRSLLYGSYTTPEFAMPAFCNLNVSWNAHAPGTPWWRCAAGCTQQGRGQPG